MDCSPPGSTVHRILQERILEWVAISFSRGSSQPNPEIEPRSPALRADSFTFWATREAQRKTQREKKKSGFSAFSPSLPSHDFPGSRRGRVPQAKISQQISVEEFPRFIITLFSISWGKKKWTTNTEKNKHTHQKDCLWSWFSIVLFHIFRHEGNHTDKCVELQHTYQYEKHVNWVE